MIIIGEKLISSIPSAREAIVARDDDKMRADYLNLDAAAL